MNYVIAGPPGSGKSSFVAQRMREGDLIVDVDTLFQALSGLPAYEKPASLLGLVLATRDFIVSQVQAEGNEFANAWVIMGGAKVSDRYGVAERMGARVYVVEMSLNECLARIMQDGRRRERAALWQPIVARWWHEYERDGRDRIVRTGVRVAA